MPVIGHADEHGIDVLAAQDLAIVDVGLYLVAKDLFGVRPPAFVHVGGSHQLDAGHLECARGIDEADDAHADRGDLDPVVGSGRLGGLDRRLELLNAVGGKCRGGESRRSGGRRRRI